MMEFLVNNIVFDTVICFLKPCQKHKMHPVFFGNQELDKGHWQ